MRPLHTLVHHGNDDVRVAAGEVGPHIGDIDVGTGHAALGEGRVAIVLVVPLIAQVGVVERGGFGLYHRLGRISRPLTALGSKRIILNQLDIADFGNLLRLGVDIRTLLQDSLVPAVQAELLFQGFLAGSGRENPLETDSAGVLHGLLLHIGKGRFKLDQDGVRGNVLADADDGGSLLDIG